MKKAKYIDNEIKRNMVKNYFLNRYWRLRKENLNLKRNVINKYREQIYGIDYYGDFPETIDFVEHHLKQESIKYIY